MQGLLRCAPMKMDLTNASHWLNPRDLDISAPTLTLVCVSPISTIMLWITGFVFHEWLQRFNSIIKMRGHNVLLLVDNAGSHTEPPTCTLSNVIVKFLPAKNTTACTSATYICDLNPNFKVQYQRYLGLHFVNCIDEKKKRNMDLRQSISIITDAWCDVKQATVANCWGHVGILQIEMWGS